MEFVDRLNREIENADKKDVLRKSAIFSNKNKS